MTGQARTVSVLTINSESAFVGREVLPAKSKSRTTISRWGKAQIMHRKKSLVSRRLPEKRPPTHPGEMLLEEFLKPLGISQSAFAIRLGVSFPRLNEIVRQKRSVTPDTALRLARVLGMPADFWLGLQQDWDLWRAMRSEQGRNISNVEPLAQHK